MNYLTRQETPKDYNRVGEVIKSAFYREDKDAGFNEWQLVEDIRNGDSYIKELSLVAEVDSKVQGHIMFSPMTIKNNENIYPSLALAPVSVYKGFQDKGIGTALVKSGINVARELGYKSIIVLGHPSYYTQFGFELASKWDIRIENNLSDYLFALELSEGALSGVYGNVEYCPEFYNEKGELI